MLRALPSPVLAAVGLTAGAGVPLAGVIVAVGEVFTVGAAVGVVVGDFAAVAVGVGVDRVGDGVGDTGVNVGVTVTGGRLTGLPCGPGGVGVAVVCVPPGNDVGTGDELATVLLGPATRRTSNVADCAPEASRAVMIWLPGDQWEPVPSHSTDWNVPCASARVEAGRWL